MQRCACDSAQTLFSASCTTVLTRLCPSEPSGVIVMCIMNMLWLLLLSRFNWCSPITRLLSPCSSTQCQLGMSTLHCRAVLRLSPEPLG